MTDFDTIIRGGCIVDGTGGKVLETTALSEPEAICIAIRPHVADIVRIGIEASAIGMWLARELKAEGLPVTVVETRHMRSALSAMRNKTDTRFVAITHNPITMARMDRLFGVTQAERGVSQLVSVDLAQAERFLLAS